MSLELSSDLVAILPIVIVVLTALIVMVVDLFQSRDLRIHAGVAGAGLALAGAQTVRAWLDAGADGAFGVAGDQTIYMLATDAFALFVWFILAMSALLTVMLAPRFLARHGAARGEFYILLLFATAGMMALAAANELVLIFLTLETFSLALYVLSGFKTTQRASQEAALKYFVLGSFAAAFLLYGAAMTFASLGTTNLTAIGVQLADAPSIPALTQVGFGMILVALAFKVAVVPFHQWTPDVYQGAPTPVTAFMAASTKAAAFAALLRVLWIGFPALEDTWLPLLALLALVSMVVGNLIAIAQADLKRMLAYSAIAHAGYIMVAAAAGPPDGAMAALFYLVLYAITNLGAFGVLIVLGENPSLDDVRGLSRRHPGLAVALAIFLLSLTGLPPTAGFLGKWYVFRAAVDADLAYLAVAVMLMSVVSAFYYMRPVLLMYMAEPLAESASATGTPVAELSTADKELPAADNELPTADKEGIPTEEEGILGRRWGLETSAGEAVAIAVSALVVAGALVLAIPFARTAEVAGRMGEEPAAQAGAPGDAIFFTAPDFNKDARP